MFKYKYRCCKYVRRLGLLRRIYPGRSTLRSLSILKIILPKNEQETGVELGGGDGRRKPALKSSPCIIHNIGFDLYACIS